MKNINDLNIKLKPLFDSDEELIEFLNTKEHWFSTGHHLENLSPLEFIQKSRRKDKFDYVLKTAKELKTTMIFPSKNSK